MILQYKKNIISLQRYTVISCLLIFVFAGAASSETKRITVVKSAGTAQSPFERITRSIVSTLNKSDVEIIEEETFGSSPLDEQYGFWEDITEKKPDLVITVGRRAAMSANRNINHIPVIFCEVANTAFLITMSHPDINGVSVRIPAEDTFAILHEAFPSAKRIGMIISPGDRFLSRSAESAAVKLGLELVTFDIVKDSEISPEFDLEIGPEYSPGERIGIGDFMKAVKELMPKIDVFLNSYDTGAAYLTNRNFLRFVLAESFKYNVPIMSIGEENEAKAGIPLAIWRDAGDMGRQAAELALRRLQQGPFRERIIETPRTIAFYINQSVASSLGITFPKSILEKAVMFGTEKDEYPGMFPYPRY